MANDTFVVRASIAKYGKTLLGGYHVDYSCPRCRHALTTTDEAVVQGDYCPHCKLRIEFDEHIKKAAEPILVAKQARDQRRQAERAEKERAKEEAKKEKARLEREAAKQYAQENEQYRSAITQQEQAERRSRERATRANARDISDATALLAVVLSLGGFGAVISLMMSFALLGSANSLNDNASSGGDLFVVGLAVAVSLAVTYGVVRILTAIHTVLVMILERLDSRSDHHEDSHRQSS